MKHYHLPEIVKFVDHLHHSKTSCSLANKKKREDKVWKIALVNLDSRPVFQYRSKAAKEYKDLLIYNLLGFSFSVLYFGSCPI